MSGSSTLEVPDALDVPGLDKKAVPLAVVPDDGGLIEADDATGVVEALVSVTGVKDEVNDIIIPGAYASTLTKRKPKGVFSHDWGRWVARTEAIEEWMPGDPRLPTKTREGDAWPSKAGALFVKMRFNLATKEGRDAYENVKFFSETGECEWSIGYHVPQGKSATGKDGIRHIKELDLFEYSPVLFGAAPLSGTLAVKSRAAALAGTPAQEVEDEFVRMLHEQGLTALDWEQMDGADALDDLLAESGESKDVLGSLALSEKLAGQNITPADRRNTDRLIRWYEHGGGAAQIRWGEDGDFMRCVRIAGKHMEPEKAKGFCANRHKGATGGWPGHAPTEQGKSLIDQWKPEAEVGEFAGTKAAAGGDTEVKTYPFLRYSYEETQSALRDALNERLLGDTLPDTDGDTSLDGGRREWSYIDLIGTFPDHCVARRQAWQGPNAGKTETYQIDYTIDPVGDVQLGDLSPVYIEVTAEMVGGAAEDAADGGADDADETEPSPAFMVFAALSGMDQAALGLEVATGVATEAKSGRVLSQRNASDLRAAWTNLRRVLAAAGVDLDAEDGADGKGDGKGEKSAEEPTETATLDDVPGEARADGSVVVDPAAFKSLVGTLRGND